MNKLYNKECSQYLTCLIEGVEIKRRLSINEMNKSHLDKKNQLGEVNAWYESIIKQVQEKPPDNYVSSIILYQNPRGEVYRITYNYSKEKENSNEIEFIIMLWNDTE